MKNRILSVILALILVFSVFPPLSGNAAEEVTYSLPVFETTDVHGHLVDTSSADPASYQYRLASIGKVISDARANGDRDTTVVLDGGDIYQGNVVSNLNHGEPMVAAYDAIGYDAVALGNHEFDWGVTTLCDSDGTMTGYYDFDENWVDCDIPVLASNIYYADTQTRVDFTQDYVILDKTAVASNGETKDVKIAVIGFAENYRSSIMPTRIAPYTIIQTADSVNAVTSLATSLKEGGQADAVILLSHWDATEAEPYFEGSEIDLILGGHSHQTQYSSSTEIPYMQAGAKAGFYGKAVLSFTEDDVTVSEIGTHSAPSNTAAYMDHLDSTVYEISQNAVASILDELSDVLGYVTQTVSEQTAGNFVCGMMNRGTGSLVSVTNSGGIRTTFKLPKGSDTRDITVGDIYTMMPFDNHLFIYRVTCAELFEAIKKDTLNYIYGVDWYPNALVVGGTCVYKDGVWLGDWETREVLVSVNEYVATINSIYLDWAEDGKLIDEVSYIDNITMIDALRAVSAENDGYIPTDTENHRHTTDFSGTLECPHSSLTPVAAVAPTCTADGNLACFRCDFCGANFDHAQTHLPDITIPALGHSYTTNCICDNCHTAAPLTPETLFLPTDAISDGDEIVILDEAFRALCTEQYSTNTQLKAKAVTVDAKVLAEASEDLIFRVESAGDNTYRFVSGEKYLTGTAQSKLTMEDTASDYSRWLLTENANGFTIQNYKAVSSKKPLYLEYYDSRYTMYTSPTTQYFYVKTALHQWDTSAAQAVDKYSHCCPCTGCGQMRTEAHTFENGTCTVCGMAQVTGQSNVFEKVTAAPTDWSGDYVIVTSYADAALANTMTTAGELDAKAMTVTDNTVTTDDAAIIWTVEAAKNNTYRIYNASGFLKIKGTGSTDAALTPTCEDTFTFETTSTAGVYRVVSVTNPARCFSYYTTSGTFRTYAKSSRATGYLFKRSKSTEALSIDSASLRLDEDIDVLYGVTVPDGYTNPYMTFTFCGRTTTVSTFTGENGHYSFAFTGVTPQHMGDNISATLYATQNGETVSVTKAEYSVKTYCENTLSKTSDGKLIALLSDLLTYGAAAQTYTGYRTDALVTADLTLSPTAFTGIAERFTTFTGEPDASADWQSAALVLKNDLAVRFTFTATSTEGLTVECTINGRTQTFTEADFVSDGDGTYYITFCGIKATEFDLSVSAAFFRSGEPLGRTVSYSVNTYLYGTQDTVVSSLAALVRTLYCYGTSAAVYAGK